MNRIQASGRNGLIKYGYRVAARLADWTLEGPHLRGSVTERDEMWLDGGGPFEVWLPFGKTFWVWKGVTLASIDPFLATLPGRPEVKH